ncbi:MAG: response regulator [Gemmatimonadales bacterium]|jgi:putative nucleotidyltransferase with HDIG domain|nr:response regulator [Gemmatimonadales bacterium]
MPESHADPLLQESTLVTTLVIDDEEPVRSALTRFLTGLGHEAIAVGSGEEALATVRRHKVACILLDVRLPDTSGLDLVPMILELEPHAAILMLTAVNDAHSAALCMQRGAMDYLVKPVDLPDLERAIGRAIARRRDLIEQAETQAWLKQEIVQRGAELRRERGSLERISVATLEALVNALEAKDPYLRGHSARIADLSASIAAEMGLKDEQVELVRTAGRLHDIGKIGIRESVLNKHGPLSPEEYEHVKTHVTIGAQILAPLTHLRDVIAYVRSHHERVDGSGYPDGLPGGAIPIGARILAAAEVYDALTTARPYQEKMTPEEAVRRMRDLIGTVIDPEVHRALELIVARRQSLVFLDERAAPG